MEKAMSEYEHLKKQKDEMLARHREPGTKCPFGCPHESEATLRTSLAASQERVRVLEGALNPKDEFIFRMEQAYEVDAFIVRNIIDHFTRPILAAPKGESR